MRTYDLFVIGMGAAFQVLDAALDAGLSCGVAERARYGGTCLNYGCIPSKVIITVADEIRAMERAQTIGLTVGKPEVDFKILKARVRERTQENEAIRKEYEAEAGLDRYGDVCFVGEKQLAVRHPDGTTGEPFTAKTIVIGAGGHVTIPDIAGLDAIPYLTPESFFGDRFPEKPYEHITIVGGGAIGCEFAHFFAATGSKVTILGRNERLVPILDDDVSAALKTGLMNVGIDVQTAIDIQKIAKTSDGYTVAWMDRHTGQAGETATSMLFLATGITSNASDLGAAATGLALDEHGYIRTNEYLETNVPGIYAIGDINGKAQFRHKANYEIETLTWNLYFKAEDEPRRSVNYRAVPACMFSHPQVASVGLSEQQAKAAGYAIRTGHLLLADVVKGYALGLKPTPEDGFVKMVVERETNRILGVSAVGHEAALLIQPYAYLMQAGEVARMVTNEDIASPLTKKERALYPTQIIDPHTTDIVERSVVIHPALSEAATWVVYELND